MLAQKKAETKKLCAFDNCGLPHYSKGACRKHYMWEYRHGVLGHGVGYFKEYVERHEELSQRGRQKISAQPRSLRRVK